MLTPEEEAEIHRSRKATDEFNQRIRKKIEQQQDFWRFVQRSDALREHAERMRKENEEKIKREREASNGALMQGALFGLATILAIWLAGVSFNYLKEFFK